VFVDVTLDPEIRAQRMLPASGDDHGLCVPAHFGCHVVAEMFDSRFRLLMDSRQMQRGETGHLALPIRPLNSGSDSSFLSS
jgi:hypothetical protein